jgi:fatty-acyl-CoA synthase
VTYLPARIEQATAGGAGITFLPGGERVEWSRLHEDARAMAGALQSRSLVPGDHVALLGPTSRPLVTAIQATWLAGATVVALPLPMRFASVADFVAQIRARMRAADTTFVVADPMVGGMVDPQPGDPPFVLLSDLTASGGGEGSFEAPEVDPAALAVLQFTSGATADPKGVMLPHHTICANLDAMAAANHLDVENDRVCGWAPLYHDLGLLGLLTFPMTTGTELFLAGPQDFLAAPGRWLEWISEYRATISAGPNFAFALATRALRRTGDLDLSRWRTALNGAEAVDPGVIDAFNAAAVPFGFDPRAHFPSFGMAEATVGVTFPEPGTGLRLDAVDRATLEIEGYALPASPDLPGTRRLARLGRALPGLEIRIVDPETGEPREERSVGELEIRGTSVTPGYYRRPDLTEVAFRHGWLRSGDLAYLVDGELVVCGRIKDLVIVGGRKIYAEDVEWAAASDRKSVV